MLTARHGATNKMLCATTAIYARKLSLTVSKNMPDIPLL
ncbi:hypothetical protein MTR67_051371 [Solanum verrucosum]|uniref:Uncharacterized protein n=1 Tax=Solanum verrucosum TaxID=315347 RepID=A0AAF0V7A2_SOLVR|nr:hypothetical protein MTR67_051371 [Solanum verrucosum]